MFTTFMSTATGRWARILAGIVLIVLGVVLGGNWLALAFLGVAPLAAGVFNVCLFGPLFGSPYDPKSAS